MYLIPFCFNNNTIFWQISENYISPIILRQIIPYALFKWWWKSWFTDKWPPAILPNITNSSTFYTSVDQLFWGWYTEKHWEFLGCLTCSDILKRQKKTDIKIPIYRRVITPVLCWRGKCCTCVVAVRKDSCSCNFWSGISVETHTSDTSDTMHCATEVSGRIRLHFEDR